MKRSECVLLITGCINPDQNVPVLTIKDSHVRLKQYIESIEYYIACSPFENIVFCDNSCAPEITGLADLANKYNKRFEWLSFQGDRNRVVTQGKGYGEGEIINYAIQNSLLMRRSRYMCKITGRLIIKNIGALTKFIDETQIYFQPNKTDDGRKYINTRIYMMPIKIYLQYFKDAYIKVDDRKGVYLENTFGMMVSSNNLKYKRFVMYPDYIGVSGSTGSNYKLSLYNLIKNTIKMYLVSK